MKEIKYPNKLKELRVDKGLTQNQLSLKTEIPLKILKGIEGGSLPLSKGFANKIAGALEIPTEEFYNYIGTRGYDNKTLVIAMAINKGGSGKSSITVNLGFALSKLGFKMLLIDTDSQMNLSSSYDFKESEKNFRQAFLNKEDIREHIVQTAYENIDLVVGSKELKNIDSEMPFMKFREIRTKTILSGVIESNEYDFILLDTNPSLGMYNTCLFYSCDQLMIPVEPGEYEVDGLDTFIQHFADMREFKPELKVLGIVANKVDKRTNISCDAINILLDVYGTFVFDAYIPLDTNIKTAHWNHVPLEIFSRYSKAVKDFDLLAIEFIEKILNQDV